MSTAAPVMGILKGIKAVVVIKYSVDKLLELLTMLRIEQDRPIQPLVS